MISKTDELFVWIWLPGATTPVVAGRVFRHAGLFLFNYGRSYLARKDAMPIFDRDLRLGEEIIWPPGEHQLAPSLRDALPDFWGRRVIQYELFGRRRDEVDVDELDELTYMRYSGSERIGALDFQESAVDYVPREGGHATLEQLQSFADRVSAGQEVPEELARVILHGSSIGGARPKALIDDRTSGHECKLIAKFSASNDQFAMVKGEYVTMRLAGLAGLSVAPVRIARVVNRDVLLVERFDRVHREGAWQRRAMVSALTWTQENEISAHHISYPMLAEIIRERFIDARTTLAELFGRLCFNILVGNTDDHARNHAAFWDGRAMTLTPAYDIAPQIRPGREANQAMLVSESSRSSQLVHTMAAAAAFLLSASQAQEIIEHQIATICQNWLAVCDEAAMSRQERNFFAGRQILNAYAFDAFPSAVPLLAE